MADEQSYYSAYFASVGVLEASVVMEVANVYPGELTLAEVRTSDGWDYVLVTPNEAVRDYLVTRMSVMRSMRDLFQKCWNLPPAEAVKPDGNA